MIGLGNSVVKRKLAGASVPAAPVNIVQPSLSGSGAVGEAVICNKGAWSGSPTPTYTYDFRLDSVSVQNSTSNSYTPLLADDGKTLTCLVTATNSQGSASEGTSNSIVIGVAPSNTIAPVVSGSTSFGSTLTTTDGTWSGTSPIIYTYQWKRNGVDITGEIANTYVIGSSDSLASITCEVKGTNAYGFDTEISNTIIVDNFVPVNTVAPTLSPSGTQSTGTVITVGNGTFTGTAPLTYAYRWKRNGSIILGETANTYTIVAGDDGTVITAEVKATNAYGESAYIGTSNQVDAVNAIAPDNTAEPGVSGTAVVGQTLSSTTGTWTGIPTPTYSYQWYRGATLISGATSSTYTLVSADAGQNIKCTVTATNTAGSASADSNTVAIFDTIMDSQTDVYNAWSMVRLLRGAYYGSPIIRLRRTNDNVESDFGVGTNGLLNESAVTTWTGSNSATLVTMYAQDGSTRHFTNTTPSGQPLFVNAGVIIKRTGAGTGGVARPAADFDGLKTLTVNSSTASYNFFHNGNTAYIAMVSEFAKTSNPDAIYAVIGNNALSSSFTGFMLSYEDRVIASANNALRIIVSSAPTTVDSTSNNAISPQLLSIITSQINASATPNANRSISYVNNSGPFSNNATGGAPKTTNATYNLQLGSAGNNSARLIGYASEIIIFNADKLAADTSIRNNINAIYKTY